MHKNVEFVADFKTIGKVSEKFRRVFVKKGVKIFSAFIEIWKRQ
jgi:hypothetical protein